MMENSVIGLVILSVIALFGLAAFYLDVVHSRRKRKQPQK
jgi:Tfp pilus assembly protein PilX